MNKRSIWTALAFMPVVAAAPSPAVAVDYLTAEQAQKVLIPGADKFVAQPVTLDKDQMKQIKALSGTPQRAAKPRVWKALDGGKLAGWVIVDEVIGKHEFITYATAISPQGKVLGVEIMSYRETKGGQVRNPKWRALFTGKTLGDQFKLGKDVPNISGATLSCRNITDGVKRLLALHKVALTS